MKNKRLESAAIISVTVAAALLAGCGCGKSGGKAPAGALADGVLTVGIVDGQDGFAEFDGTAYVGIEPQIIEICGRNNSVSIEYKEAADTKDLVRLLDEGSIDLAAGRLGMSEIYGQNHVFSRNYAKKGLYLVTEKNLYADSLASFFETTVGTSADIPSYVLQDIDHLGELQQIVYDDAAKIPADMAAGTITAAVCTEREAMDLLEGGNVQAMEIVNGPRMETVFYMNPDQNDLKAAVDQAINEFLDQQS